MKLKAILAVTLFSLVINGSAWAKIWNCELEVLWGSGGAEDPCIVGATDGDWVKGLKQVKGDATKQASYTDYYKSCTNITTVIKEINDDESRCKVEGWNMIFFKTDDVMAKDSKFKSPSNSDDKKVMAEELWADRSDFNGGEITITDSSTIKTGSTVLLAGYNVLVDNDDDDTCLGDPNDDGPCKADANDPNNTPDGKPINLGGSEQCEDYGECGDDDFGAEPDWDSDESGASDSDTAEQDEAAAVELAADVAATAAAKRAYDYMIEAGAAANKANPEAKDANLVAYAAAFGVTAGATDDQIKDAAKVGGKQAYEAVYADADANPGMYKTNEEIEAAAVQEAASAEAKAKEKQEDNDMKDSAKEMDKEQEVEYKYNGSKKYSNTGTSFCPVGYYEHEWTGGEGEHFISCLDSWTDDIQTDDMGYHYGMNLTSPVNWIGSKYYGEEGYKVTIFAGHRKQNQPSAPFGSYSKITVNNKEKNSSAFTVKGTLILRDLQIFVKNGRLATIKSGGRLFLDNVVISCGDDKKVCDSDSLIENNGQLFMDPNARFYVSKNVISKIPEHFGYIDLNKGSTVSFYSHEQDAYIPLSGKDLQNASHNGELNATALPGKFFPIKADTNKNIKINLQYGDEYNTKVLNMTLDKCQTVFSISKGYLVSNFADDLLLSLSNKLSDPYSPYFDRSFICGDTAYKFERDCDTDKYIIEANGKISCQPSPGKGWEYDEATSSFVCDEKGGAIKLSDGTCLKNGCPYGSDSNAAGNACECKAGTKKFESEDSFICIKTCSEKDQINWIKKDLLKDGSADGTNPKGKLLVYFGNLGESSDGFTALSNKDKCDCVSPYTMVNGACVVVEEETAKCVDIKGPGAVYNTSTGKCGCGNGYLDINGKCEASIANECSGKGSTWKYDSSTNKCVCKLEGANPATCACPAGTVETPGGSCKPPPECYENSNCDSGKVCEGGKCEASIEDECSGKGSTWKYDSSINKCVCKLEGANPATCACPAGTVETPGGSCKPPPECSEDSECDDGEICQDEECVDKDEPPLGGECKSNSDCGTGMICSSTEECKCDTNNNFYPASADAKTCEFKEPAVGGICELSGGQYLQERCIYNKSESACIIGGGAWEGGQCVSSEESLAEGGGGCSCNLASEAAAPAGSMGMALAYLTMLGSIILVRLRKKA